MTASTWPGTRYVSAVVVVVVLTAEAVDAHEGHLLSLAVSRSAAAAAAGAGRSCARSVAGAAAGRLDRPRSVGAPRLAGSVPARVGRNWASLDPGPGTNPDAVATGFDIDHRRPTRPRLPEKDDLYIGE